MNEHKHTKGPWRVSNDGNDIETSHEHSPTGICSMYLYEQSEADAKLIAAAPELLEAAEAAYTNLLPAYPQDHIVMRKLKSAIQKATQI